MRPFGALLVALICVACGAVGPDENTDTLTIATSIAPHAWLIERIGGERVVVHTVLRPGESPTTHQPSDAQVSRVLSGRLFFRSGVPFESGAWFRALEGHLEIVDLREGVLTRTMESHAHPGDTPDRGAHHHRDAVDPHIWLSPRRLMVQAELAAESLQRLDPEHASDYGEGLSDVLIELAELEAWIESTLSPYRGRAFVIFHPSWGYFADDFDIRQIAIETEGKEPSDAELTRIQEQIRAIDASVIYVQPQIAGQSAQAIADAVGARLETLDPLAPDVVSNLRRAAEVLAEGFDD